MKKLIFGAILILSIFFWHKSNYTTLTDGVEYAVDSPIQRDLSKDESLTFDHYKHPEYKITKLAEYDIKAKVISKKKYTTGDASNLAPIDFALGWSKLSDEFYVSHDLIKFSQSNRWYKYRYKNDYPLKKSYIAKHSANTHIVPANDLVKKQVMNVGNGDVVHMNGYLIKIKRDDGWHWNSSTTRGDVGNGACEIMYVENIEIIAD